MNTQLYTPSRNHTSVSCKEAKLPQINSLSVYLGGTVNHNLITIIRSQDGKRQLYISSYMGTFYVSNTFEVGKPTDNIMATSVLRRAINYAEQFLESEKISGAKQDSFVPYDI